MSLTERLFELTETGRFPHALLFTGGRDGADRENAARRAAALLVCENPEKKPCGNCAACRKAFLNSHPDIIFVTEHMPDGKYKIESLRSVIAETYVRPNDGNVKVYIFSDCREMSPLCQNTLLKVVEEPAPFNRFIFTAQFRGELLPTLVSRLAEFPLDTEIGETSKDNEIQTSESEAANKTAREIADGFAKQSEYAVAAAFAGIKERRGLGDALKQLSDLVRGALLYINGGVSSEEFSEEAKRLSRVSNESLVLMEKEILKIIAEQEFNPNTPLAAAAYSSRLWCIFRK